MKLFKVIECVGLRASTFFLPQVEDLAVDPQPYFTASQYEWIWRILREMGFSDYHIKHMLTAWVTQLSFDMRFRGPAVWTRISAIVGAMYDSYLAREHRKTIIYWVAAGAVLIIGTILFDPTLQTPIKFRPPREMYVLVYEERVWLAELAAVSPGGVGLYEQGGPMGGSSIIHERFVPFEPGVADKIWFLGTSLHAFRHYVRWYRYYWDWFICHYAGVCTHIGGNLYKLRAGGDDPFLPDGPWYRPGDRWGTPEYDGIYKDWRWLSETFG